MNKLKVLTVVIVSFLAASVQTFAAPSRQKPVEAAVVIDEFRKHVEKVPFFSDSAVTAAKNEIEEHIKCLRNWSDRKGYVEEHHLNTYLSTNRDSLQYYKGLASVEIDNFMKQYTLVEPEDEPECRNGMMALLNDKLSVRETNLNLLDKELNSQEGGSSLNWKLIGTIVGALLLLGILIALLRRNKQPAVPQPSNVQRSNRSGSGQQGGNEPGIIVRRKTATILKKQSLEDVIGNPNYLQVDAVDFCYESAVRRMYIKNTCIIDIYNMYAEDLRNSNHPSENGCMVLGRWVHDDESKEYYVSLEQIVLPGDDAVFDEYELNFGGKIKLRVLEQLRKLRRETNFQYDLTCWVHSHPGLSVFFSNSDVSVQEQLKHPQHPNFLTALVVDILTPTQEVGIFTYRRDANINSKNDLKRMYSLKEWYDWAVKSLEANPEGHPQPMAEAEVQTEPQVESVQDTAAEMVEDVSFNHADFFNMLSNAKVRTDTCNGIHLNREVIVDMCMSIGTAQGSALLGYVHGRSLQHEQKVEHLAEQLSNNEQADDKDLLGCFVVDAHRSIPSIRKAVEDCLDKIMFVLVYQPTTGMLTSIPVVDSELSTEESNYGEQKLEDLKIWTRKK
jgi:hypothetical protein